MKSKHNAIAIIAASLFVVTGLNTIGGIYSLISTYVRYYMNEIHEWIRPYYVLEIASNVVFLIGIIIVIIALYARNRKHLGAIGYTVLTVSCIIDVASFMFSVLHNTVKWSYVVKASVMAFPIILPIAFSMIQLWILAGKPGQLKGLRNCWMLGPVILTIYKIITTVNYAKTISTYFSDAIPYLLLSLFYYAGYYLAMLWLAFANADSVQRVAPAQPDDM